jgi:hypothetical protein
MKKKLDKMESPPVRTCELDPKNNKPEERMHAFLSPMLIPREGWGSFFPQVPRQYVFNTYHSVQKDQGHICPCLSPPLDSEKRGQGVGEEAGANSALTSLYRRGTQYISDVTNKIATTKYSGQS